MNYQKIYDNLILSRSEEPLKHDEYYEKHHIRTFFSTFTFDKNTPQSQRYKLCFIVYVEETHTQ